MRLQEKNLVMDLKSLPLFPIPISVCNFGEENHNLNIDLVKDTIEEKSKDPKGEDHSNVGGWHSKPDLETKYKSYSQLSFILTKYGNLYCKQHGYKDGLVCTDLWANLNQSGDLNFMHHHGTTALAGVYYPIESIVDKNLNFNYTTENPIKAGTWNNNDGGSLIFQDPAYGKKVHLIKDKSSPFNVDFYHIYPTSSILVLFPTYLLHMVLPFKENKIRMSISFAFSYGKS
jgi:hypothetical protein